MRGVGIERDDIVAMNPIRFTAASLACTIDVAPLPSRERGECIRAGMH